MSRRLCARSFLHALRVGTYTFASVFVVLAGTVSALQVQPDGALVSPLNVTTNQLIYLLAPGNQATGKVTTTICCGFDYNVFLSASGVPAGCSISFSPGVIPAPGSGSSTMIISIGINTAPGRYPITIIATGGGVKATATIYLLVT